MKPTLEEWDEAAACEKPLNSLDTFPEAITVNERETIMNQVPSVVWESAFKSRHDLYSDIKAIFSYWTLVWWLKLLTVAGSFQLTTAACWETLRKAKVSNKLFGATTWGEKSRTEMILDLVYQEPIATRKGWWKKETRLFSWVELLLHEICWQRYRFTVTSIYSNNAKYGVIKRTVMVSSNQATLHLFI